MLLLTLDACCMPVLHDWTAEAKQIKTKATGLKNGNKNKPKAKNTKKKNGGRRQAVYTSSGAGTWQRPRWLSLPRRTLSGADHCNTVSVATDAAAAPAGAAQDRSDEEGTRQLPSRLWLSTRALTMVLTYNAASVATDDDEDAAAAPAGAAAPITAPAGRPLTRSRIGNLRLAIPVGPADPAPGT